MSAEMLIIFALLGALALWVVAGIIDARDSRRPAPRIVQVRRVPPLPPDRARPGLPRHDAPRGALTRADLAHARRTRARLRQARGEGAR